MSLILSPKSITSCLKPNASTSDCKQGSKTEKRPRGSSDDNSSAERTPKSGKKKKDSEQQNSVEIEGAPEKEINKSVLSKHTIVSKKQFEDYRFSLFLKEYSPQCGPYHPINNATWKRGERVPYSALYRTLEEIDEITDTRYMIEMLSNYFRSVIVLNPDDLLPSLYLCFSKIAPACEGLKLGIAKSILMKAIALSTGRTENEIKNDAGDLGEVAVQSKLKQRMIFYGARLTVRGVFDELKEISQMTGDASETEKVEKIQAMLVATQCKETRYLIKSLLGELTISLTEQSVLQALALACAMTPPSQEYPPEELNASRNFSAEGFRAEVGRLALLVKTAYCECPNYDKIIPVILKEGIDKLPDYCTLTPGIPFRPMLAYPINGIGEVVDKFRGATFTCEWKYPGVRVQIHISENDVSIISRNQRNHTSKYPDIISTLDKCKTDEVKSCILDCEVVAWDKEKQQILPFQILSTRKRKVTKAQVCVFMFDLIYLNDVSLVKKPFKERREFLRQYFKEHEEEWLFAKSLDTADLEEVQEFLDESVKGNCEGLMVKSLKATYAIAKRSRNWLKLKKNDLDCVGDTLDLVVIGGYLGKGERTGTYGGFLLACYDTVTKEYQTICKMCTGFTDEDLETHTEFLKNHVVPQPKSYYRYDSSLEPDHWFEPVQVWEIKCADLTTSDVHSAGVGNMKRFHREKGVSLIFPRFIRIRDDKDVEDATSSYQVADMYYNQFTRNRFDDEYEKCLLDSLLHQIVSIYINKNQHSP